MSALPPKADIGRTTSTRPRARLNFPAGPPAISGGAGLEHPSGSVTPLAKSVTVWTGGRAVSMENSRLRKAAPTAVNVTVGQRSREYLTDREVERLIEAAKQNRSGHRDATAILVAYRHAGRSRRFIHVVISDGECAWRGPDVDSCGHPSLSRRLAGACADVRCVGASRPYRTRRSHRCEAGENGYRLVHRIKVGGCRFLGAGMDKS